MDLQERFLGRFLETSPGAPRFEFYFEPGLINGKDPFWAPWRSSEAIELCLHHLEQYAWYTGGSLWYVRPPQVHRYTGGTGIVGPPGVRIAR